ncbi:hypothetical protein [Pantoea agglomerans]|uniref:hypothetical protein n=1 Tax=Enterobacter agglomerans TaxID=549 RepID=UPI0016541C99|nr:hypothetical protein [Pantoea agglomerans]
MKNTLYDIDDLYQATRRYFMNSFPYPGESVSGAIMNLELQRNSSKARIISSNQFGNTTFENPEPIQKTESIYGESYGFTLEEYLSNDASRRYVMEDLKELKKWMIKEEFLYAEKGGLLATEKLLRTKKLTQ